jgi:hypothetical protein
MRTLLAFGLLWGLAAATAPRLAAQNADLLLNDDAYHLIDRLDVQGSTMRNLPTDVRPYPREWVAQWLAEADTTGMGYQEIRWLRLTQHRLDDRVPATRTTGPLRRTFFRNHRDLFSAQTPNGKNRLYLNPNLYGSGGANQSTPVAPASATVMRNSRGASLRATAFGIVGIYADFSDNQATYPRFISAYNAKEQAIWGEGYYKPFKTNGVDFIAARGYVTVSPIPQLRIKLGRDRAFMGNGYQSLFLSDHATDYYLLNVNTRIWKFEYINHFAQLVDYIANKPDNFGAQPRKFLAMHQLTYRPTRQLALGLFESIVYAAHLPNGYRGFELQYLNPIIFYRAAEQFTGSSDNALMGANFKANLLRRFQLYGQLLLDDFNFSMSRTGPNYFGNKIGYQAGLKWVNVLGLRMVDLQAEFNRIRPYTYAHYNIASNYAHYGNPLAHPRGANVNEAIGILRVRPHARLGIEALAAYTQQGLDPTDRSRNYGGNIFRSDNTRNNGLADPRFNNTVGQGNPWTLLRASLRLTYQIMSLDAFVDLEAHYRQETYQGVKTSDTAAWLSLRWMLAHKPVRF